MVNEGILLRNKEGRTIQGPIVPDLLDLSLAYEHPGPEPNINEIGREES